VPASALLAHIDRILHGGQGQTQTDANSDSNGNQLNANSQSAPAVFTPPLLSTLQSLLVDAQRRFPRLALLLTAEAVEGLIDVSDDVVLQAARECSLIPSDSSSPSDHASAMKLKQVLVRLSSLVWGGVWWVRCARRILDRSVDHHHHRASSASLLTLTPDQVITNSTSNHNPDASPSSAFYPPLNPSAPFPPPPAFMYHWYQQGQSLANESSTLAHSRMDEETKKRLSSTSSSSANASICDVPYLDVCPDSIMHLMRDIVQRSTTRNTNAATSTAVNGNGPVLSAEKRDATNNGSSGLGQYSICCAQALLSCPLLPAVSIPEVSLLQSLLHRSEELVLRCRTVLTAESYRLCGIAPPPETAERETFIMDAHESETLFSTSFRNRVSAGSTAPSVATLEAMEWEARSIGLGIVEQQVLATQINRARAFQNDSSKCIETVHALLVRCHSNAMPPSDDDLGQLELASEHLRQMCFTAEVCLALFPDACHMAMQLASGVESLLAMHRTTATAEAKLRQRMETMRNSKEKMIAQAHMQMQQQMDMQMKMQMQQAQMQSQQPQSSLSNTLQAPSTPSQLPQQQSTHSQAAPHPQPSPKRHFHSAQDMIGVLPLLTADPRAHASILSAAAAPPPPSAPFHSSTGRYPMVKTVGDMLDRLHFVENNPLIGALSRDERELFQGFSLQTVQRYQKSLSAASQAGVNLEEYRPLNFSLIPQLLAASPKERQLMLEQAILDGGSKRSLYRRPMGLPVANANADHGGAEWTMDGAGSDRESGPSISRIGAAAAAAAAASGASTAINAGNRGNRLVEVLPELSHLPSYGQTPVPLVQVLSLPPPKPEDRNDPNSIHYRVNGVLASNERKRLLRFVREHGFFTDGGLLPFKGPLDIFGNLHPTRKAKAIRMIQDEFHTCPVWTRRFLASTHGNNRRMHIEKIQMRKKGTTTSQTPTPTSARNSHKRTMHQRHGSGASSANVSTTMQEIEMELESKEEQM